MKADKYCVRMSEDTNGAEIWLTAEPEDITPEQEAKYLGNPPGFLEAIKRAIQNYGRWGWCTMKISYVRDGREGCSYLACASYTGAYDFRECGYYRQKVVEAQQAWKNTSSPARPESRIRQALEEHNYTVVREPQLHTAGRAPGTNQITVWRVLAGDEFTGHVVVDPNSLTPWLAIGPQADVLASLINRLE